MDDLASYASVFLQNAEDDLRSAAQASSAERYDVRNRAYNSQQAAEKALKAALALTGVNFDRTHDLNQLCGGLPPDWGITWPPSDLARLTNMVATARYGNGGTAPSKSDADWAFGIASDIVGAIRTGAARRGI
ncbi:MAG: HEPN domain-containing protein [Nitrosopumilaceae archaeon]|nr:HEPN domain-containing protein [Nitrosopumilaceae archaeon]